MSYILDALRRADAERNRGAVPSLHAQPSLRGAHAATAAPGRTGTALVVSAAALSAGAVAMAAWWFWPTPGPGGRGDSTPLARAREPTAPSAAVVPAPASVPAALPEPVPGTVPAPVPSTAAPVSAPTEAAAPSMATAPPPLQSAPPAPARPATRPAPQPTAPTGPGMTVAQPGAAATPTRLADLSPEQRRELPALALGGSIQSDNPASRFVLINGQVVHEGEAAAPGVTVLRIRPRVLWLRWREQVIEMPL